MSNIFREHGDFRRGAFGDYADAWARFSPDGKHRTLLGRRWSPLLPDVRWLFAMLNPSAAGADKDDPTVRRCFGFANDGGATSFEVVNEFTPIDSNPAALSRCGSPIWPDVAGADEEILAAARRAQVIVAAWGVRAATRRALRSRGERVLALLQIVGPVHCLRLTASGHPEHPLYLPGDLRPQAYRPALEPRVP